MRNGCIAISEFINIVSISYYTFIEFIVLLFACLVTSFAWYKNMWFDGFHLVNVSMYYLFLLAQVLLVIFEKFV